MLQDQAVLALILQMVTHMVISPLPQCAMSIPICPIVTATTPNRVKASGVALGASIIKAKEDSFDLYQNIIMNNLWL